MAREAVAMAMTTVGSTPTAFSSRMPALIPTPMQKRERGEA